MERMEKELRLLPGDRTIEALHKGIFIFKNIIFNATTNVRDEEAIMSISGADTIITADHFIAVTRPSRGLSVEIDSPEMDDFQELCHKSRPNLSAKKKIKMLIKFGGLAVTYVVMSITFEYLPNIPQIAKLRPLILSISGIIGGVVMLSFFTSLGKASSILFDETLGSLKIHRESKLFLIVRSGSGLIISISATLLLNFLNIKLEAWFEVHKTSELVRHICIKTIIMLGFVFGIHALFTRIWEVKLKKQSIKNPILNTIAIIGLLAASFAILMFEGHIATRIPKTSIFQNLARNSLASLSMLLSAVAFSFLWKAMSRFIDNTVLRYDFQNKSLLRRKLSTGIGLMVMLEVVSVIVLVSIVVIYLWQTMQNGTSIINYLKDPVIFLIFLISIDCLLLALQLAVRYRRLLGNIVELSSAQKFENSLNNLSLNFSQFIEFISLRMNHVSLVAKFEIPESLLQRLEVLKNKNLKLPDRNGREELSEEELIEAANHNLEIARETKALCQDFLLIFLGRDVNTQQKPNIEQLIKIYVDNYYQHNVKNSKNIVKNSVSYRKIIFLGQNLRNDLLDLNQLLQVFEEMFVVNDSMYGINMRILKAELESKRKALDAQDAQDAKDEAEKKAVEARNELEKKAVEAKVQQSEEKIQKLEAILDNPEVQAFLRSKGLDSKPQSSVLEQPSVQSALKPSAAQGRSK